MVNEVKSLKNEVSGVGVGVHRFVHNSPIHGGQHHSHRHHVHHVHHNSISPNRLSGGRQNHLSPPPDPLPRSNSDSSIHQNTYPGKMMTNGPAAFRKGSLYHIFLLVHCVRMFYHYTWAFKERTLTLFLILDPWNIYKIVRILQGMLLF